MREPFPTASTHLEYTVLEPYSKRYDNARSTKRGALILSALALVAGAADIATDRDAGYVAPISAGIFGGAAYVVARECRKQQAALADAQHSMRSSPIEFRFPATDLPTTYGAANMPPDPNTTPPTVSE